ncbi:hypothetical protein LMUR_02152 [Listeria grayi FSL F6-1183]|uniref:Carbamate kinase n=1 Tax=Listeria grayi FSL F6-1183 TaxID=1265827 RepID=A0A829RB94_LISGR|nr:hypothetical protein LMUR_02152 [Listeria grayi FSL F6-1183]
MRKLRIVVALGGNAILTDDASANAQKKGFKRNRRIFDPADHRRTSSNHFAW